MGTKVKTNFLISDASHVSGAARLLDWAGQFDQYNTSGSGREADGKALAADWRMVGQDIEDAMKEFEKSQAA